MSDLPTHGAKRTCEARNTKTPADHVDVDPWQTIRGSELAHSQLAVATNFSRKRGV
jgi:hypothetical protein